MKDSEAFNSLRRSFWIEGRRNQTVCEKAEMKDAHTQLQLQAKEMLYKLKAHTTQPDTLYFRFFTAI